MKALTERGVLTDNLKFKYGSGINKVQLRLLPYLQYLLMNSKPVDPAKISSEEREVLQAWRDKGLITFSMTDPCTCTKAFWDWMCGILFESYVLEKEEEERL